MRLNRTVDQTCLFGQSELISPCEQKLAGREKRTRLLHCGWSFLVCKVFEQRFAGNGLSRLLDD